MNSRPDTSKDDRETSRFGRYEIIRKIASGGMGEVYLAKSIGAAGFAKHVVIKKILPHLVEHPQTVRSLVREAKLLVMLNHPVVVQVLDLGVEGNDYFMAMEYVHGYNLSTVLHYCSKKKQIIPAVACVHVALEVLSALAYAHELVGPDGVRQNIIHRDVSPQNVMITYDGRIKLTDFGIAKVLSEADDEHTQSLKGKWRYMAPEVVLGKRIDQRYDLFAVGILLFESLCRRNLFSGKRDVDILNKVRETKIPSLTKYYPDLPDSIAEVTYKALKRNPEQRFQTARQFAESLREAILPTSESQAAAELKAFVGDLFEESDFPVNKPKLVDPHSIDPNSTRSIILKSRLTGEDLPGAHLPRLQIRPSVALLSIILVFISSVVAYLAYRILYSRPASSSDKPPVIIVSERAPKTAPPPDASVEPASDAVIATPSKRRTRMPRPKPFTPKIGARTFRKHQPALSRCFAKHGTKDDLPELSLKVTSTISTSGRVEKVTLEPGNLESTVLGRCVIRAVKKIRYPRHNKPSVRFVQPIKLKHRSAGR